MIIYHQRNVAAFTGNEVWYWPLQPFTWAISVTSAGATGRIMSSLAWHGGLAWRGGLAGSGGGLAG